MADESVLADASAQPARRIKAAGFLRPRGRLSTPHAHGYAAAGSSVGERAWCPYPPFRPRGSASCLVQCRSRHRAATVCRQGVLGLGALGPWGPGVLEPRSPQPVGAGRRWRPGALRPCCGAGGAVAAEGAASFVEQPVGGAEPGRVHATAGRGGGRGAGVRWGPCLSGWVLGCTGIWSQGCWDAARSSDLWCAGWPAGIGMGVTGRLGEPGLPNGGVAQPRYATGGGEEWACLLPVTGTRPRIPPKFVTYWLMERMEVAG